jgi:hypothetical protein
MTRTLLLALLAAVPAAATPLPDHERERLAVHQQYGDWTDSDGGSTFRVSGSGVRVMLPADRAARRNLVASPDAAPGLSRAVTGDFTVVVRVGCPECPADTPPGGAVAGGLRARDVSGHGVVFTRAEYAAGDSAPRLGANWQGPNIAVGAGYNPGPIPGRTLLRMTRSGPSVSLAWSPHGREWHTCQEFTRIGWADTVRVGVFAESMTGRPAEVTFDCYTLTQPQTRPEGSP